MLITSHLAATLLMAKGLTLEGSELWIALAGGAALDVDHFFVNTKWTSDIKSFLREGKITHGEVKQHSWIQEPISGIIVGAALGGILATFFPVRWWIFLLFQMLHIVMDSFMKYEHQPFAPFYGWKYFGMVLPGSKIEFVSSSLLLLAVWWLP